MNYNKRLSAAIALSLVAHVILVVVASLNKVEGSLERISLADPIVLNLTPPERQEPRRLVETNQPAEDIQRDTDLISNEASAARDESGGSGEESQPAVDRIDEFEELGAPPTPPPSPPIPPVEQPAPPTPEPQPAAPEAPKTEPPAEEKPVEPDPVLTVAKKPEAPEISSESFPAPEVSASDKPAEETQEKSPETEPLPEPFEVAQNTLPPQTVDLGATRGRESEGAEVVGPLSFEANKHALGEYMLRVRRAVERTWRTSLQFKYSGTQQATATLECAIRPDGQVAHVKILEHGESMIYAALCKQAIERAAPFGPFPFEVPEAYRSENLVIRWKFSFM